MQTTIDAIAEAKRNALHAIHRANSNFDGDQEHAALIVRLQELVTDLTAAENQAVRMKSRRDLAAEPLIVCAAITAA